MSARDARLRRLYGIGEDDYELVLRVQGGRCAICHRVPEPGRNFNVDHDHKSGVVRGVLCPHCNRYVVGRARDAQQARRVADYLLSPPATTALGIRIVPAKPRRRRKAA